VYEAPAIVERTEVGRPLVAVTSIPTSAVFRTIAVYEAPAVVERTEVGRPLVLVASGGGGG
jgi:hypothetical protein